MHYTARDGGKDLRAAAVEDFNTQMNALALAEKRLGLFRVFDLKREYPDEWYRFLHPATAAGDQELKLDDLPDRLPYFTRGFTNKKVRKIEVVARMKDGDEALYKVMLSPLSSQDDENTWLSLELAQSPTYQGMHMALADLAGKTIGFAAWTLKIRLASANIDDFKSLPSDAIQELFLIINYTID
jgi:hypothetical protein